MGKRFVGKAAYKRIKDAAQKRSRDLSAAGRDIGEMPPVGDQARKDAAAVSLRLFCETYLRRIFSRPWSQDHLDAIRKMENSIRNGDLYAFAMPRGFGKTKLCEAACLWAVLYGYRKFVVLIGATATAGRELLENIRTHLETNKLIGEDFPEVCVPLRKLEGIGQRRLLYRGEWIRMELTRRRVIFPAIPANPAAGSILWATGITGRIRGISLGKQSEDADNLRPDLVVLDDPQTRKSAKSKGQIDLRMKTLSGDVLGLAGHDNKIAGFMPCTIIEPNDMAHQILDRATYPEWRGSRTTMVREWGTVLKDPETGADEGYANETLWREYADIRAAGLRDDEDDGTCPAAVEFVRQHFELLHAGSEVSWPECYLPDNGELSALHHAWNLRLKHGDAGFFAEFQNEPIDADNQSDPDDLTVEKICGRINNIPFGRVPVFSEILTGFIDVHKRLLYWIVCAYRLDFTCAVVDYGTWPRQKTRYFSMAKSAPTIQTIYKNRGSLEAQIYAALTDCTEYLFKREWTRDDGAILTHDQCLIDANWGEMRDTVYTFIGESKHKQILMPSHGKGLGVNQRPMTDYVAKPNERIHLNFITRRGEGNAVKHAIIDTNQWKSFTHARLSAAPGEPGNMLLPGSKPEMHKLFGEHITAETRARPPGGIGRDIWTLPDNKPDNHWFDGLVGCNVGASLHGAVLAEHRKPRRKRVKWSEVQQQARDRR